MRVSMTHTALKLEAELDVLLYFCRVPSFSNIADGLSRLSFHECEMIGAERIQVEEPLLVSSAGMDGPCRWGCLSPAQMTHPQQMFLS